MIILVLLNEYTHTMYTLNNIYFNCNAYIVYMNC